MSPHRSSRAASLLAAGLPFVFGPLGAALGAAPPGPESVPATTEPGPAQRLGAQVDQATARLRAWLSAHSDQASAAAEGLEKRVGVWGEKAKVELWGEPGAPRPAAAYLATQGPDGVTQWVNIEAVRGSALPDHVVLLVHGLDEPGPVWEDLTPVLLKAGHAAIKFEYPNDGRIAAAADQLGETLVRLRSAGVRRIDLVGHSMGGLVCRDVLSRPEWYAGPRSAELPTVGTLFMLATPHRGSVLAFLQPISEAREHISRAMDGTNPVGAGLVHSYGDGDGEAGLDLAVDSPFLKDLNARPAPQGVRLVNIVACVLPSDVMQAMGDRAEKAVAYLGFEPAGSLKNHICAAGDSLGDGMVSTCGSSLAWPAENICVRGDHRSVIRRWHVLDGIGLPKTWTDEPAPAIPIILDRLKAQ